jgi:hypothetical protein
MAPHPASHHSRRFEAEPEFRQVFVDTGREGARRRWGPPRSIHLGSLPAPIRAGIVALVDALKSSEEVER